MSNVANTPSETNEKTDGVALIAAERQRQMNEKGWTAEHDDGHTDQTIAHAAFYILNVHLSGSHVPDGSEIDRDDLPWPDRLADHVQHKYANDPVRRLTIAGALIAAEIDRLQRAEGREKR
jgi:hypothetical protein